MTRPLNVLILGRDPDMFASRSGAPNDTHERHLRYVAELLRRRPGSQVRAIVHTRRPGGERYAQPIEGFEIYGTYSRTRLHCPIDVARLVSRFHREGWIPDVISCQTGYEEGPLALLLARRESRVQIQIHNDFYGDAFANERPIQYIQRHVIRRTVRRCDHVRAVSTGIRQSLVDSGDIGSERISIAPVPIIFEAEPRKTNGDAPVVLFVGRLVAQKDLGLWCDVAERIHCARPQVEFWIAGEGQERAILEKRLAAFGGKMKLLGEVRYADLAPIYASASVFLLTSLYEGLGRVVVEAMLSGVPVVSVDIVGPRDLIATGQNGVLVGRSAELLAQAAIEFLSDPARAERIGCAGKVWAEQNYGFDAVAEKLVASWETAAALPKRRA